MLNKDKQLGMLAATASSRLRKEVMFSLVKELGKNHCYRCKEEICSAADFSLDHKVDWIGAEKPLELFFDLNNVAFSHLKCNTGTRRKPMVTLECGKCKRQFQRRKFLHKKALNNGQTRFYCSKRCRYNDGSYKRNGNV